MLIQAADFSSSRITNLALTIFIEFHLKLSSAKDRVLNQHKQLAKQSFFILDLHE